MEQLLQDLRLALRSLLRSPGYLALAAVTLALGFGANTAMFSVIRAVLLKPLPYPDPGSLMMVWEHNLPREHPRNVVSPGNYVRWQERANSFSGLAMYTWSSTVFTGGDLAERVSGRAITPNLLGVLRVTPALGRGFTEEEGLPGGGSVVLLSHDLWQRRFAGDPGIVGKAVPIAGGSVTVVGVMPAGFRPLGTEEYWEPFVIGERQRIPRGRYAMVLGRLRPGVTPAQAQAEMAGIASGLAQEFPEFDTGWTTDVVPLTEQVVGGARRMLWILFGAVAVVLLIGCANVANLTLVRAAARERETGVRMALGAPRRRLVRQWLLESLLVSLFGGVIGLGVAVWGVDLLRSLGPSDIPRLSEVRVDRGVLAVTAGFVLLTGFLFGLPAALGHRRLNPAALHGGESRTAGSTAATRWRHTLVVVQLSLALVLLAGAGLLLRSLGRLLSEDPGFDPHGVLTMELNLPPTYQEEGQRAAFFSRLSDRVQGLPGVQAAGMVSALPLTGLAAATGFTVVSQPPPAAGQEPVADIRIVQDDYFAALRIPLLRGRLLSRSDDARAPPVVLINETAARELWAGRDPLGDRLQISWNHPEQQPMIVGVVGDVKHGGLDAVVRPMIYYPWGQSPTGFLVMTVRSDLDPTTLGAALRREVRALDGTMPLGDIATMSVVMSESVSDRRYPMLLLGLFAGIAVALSAVGIYGVVAYGVGQRTREFGIRLALGATPGSVSAMVLRGGLWLALVGVGLGAVAAGFTTRLLRGLLFGVVPADPITFSGVAVLLTVVVLLAAWLPARRASRVDPLVAMRAE